MADKINVEVAYARPDTQVIKPVSVDMGTQVRGVIELSGLLEQFPEIDLAHNKVGVFSKVVALDQELREGDRVEIYRPLIADPKEVRRQRAAQGKPMRKGEAEPT
ncbi:MAG: RnfH family protein [Pseudomonadota bacterium]